MITYIELWKIKDTWKELSQLERQNYLQKMALTLPDMINQGVEILDWGSNDLDTNQRAGYDFFAIWRFPDKSRAVELEKLLHQAQWYHYFDQINISGLMEQPEEIIGKLISI